MYGFFGGNSSRNRNSSNNNKNSTRSCSYHARTTAVPRDSAYFFGFIHRSIGHRLQIALTLVEIQNYQFKLCYWLIELIFMRLSLNLHSCMLYNSAVSSICWINRCSISASILYEFCLARVNDPWENVNSQQRDTQSACVSVCISRWSNDNVCKNVFAFCFPC